MLGNWRTACGDAVERQADAGLKLDSMLNRVIVEAHEAVAVARDVRDQVAYDRAGSTIEELGRIGVIDLKPSSVLVFMTAEHLSPEAAKLANQILRDRFPDHSTVILEGRDWSVAAIHQDIEEPREEVRS